MPLTRAELARRFPLPPIDPSSDKYGRGVALVAGGSTATAGAVVLAGVAALRAGAGKLRIATVEEAIATVSIAVPEAGVFALGSGRIDELVSTADAVLVGTGMLDKDEASTALARVLRAAGPTTVVAIDACALGAAVDHEDAIRQRPARGVLLLPNANEAGELGEDAAAIARRFDATVSLRAPTTTVVSAAGAVEIATGNVGLATSGSGDVEVGIALGLLTRGADPMTAAAWASFVHGAAGDRLAERVGPVGYLARELLDEVPSLLDAGD